MPKDYFLRNLEDPFNINRKYIQHRAHDCIHLFTLHYLFTFPAVASNTSPHE